MTKSKVKRRKFYCARCAGLTYFDWIYCCGCDYWSTESFVRVYGDDIKALGNKLAEDIDTLIASQFDKKKRGLVKKEILKMFKRDIFGEFITYITEALSDQEK